VLVAVGLNQKGATVADRQILALAPDQIRDALAGYAALDGIDEVAVLSTCYRVEIYAASRCPSAATVGLRQALTQRAGRDLPLFELQGEEAFRHLLRVASSLESAILGEPQILGQVKEAFGHAVDADVAGRELTAAMNRAFQVAKRIRTETAIGRAGVSWGSAAATLAEKVLGPLGGRRAVIVGAGEMARVTANHLREAGCEIVVLNRTLQKAEALAAKVGGRAGALAELEAELVSADLVVAAAPAGMGDLFGAEAVKRVLRARRRRIVLVDLAVPRAIPPQVGSLEDVYLCDVDDLERVLRAAMSERSSAVTEAERIIEEEMLRFAREQAERRAGPLIHQMRARAEAIAREEVERTLRRLGQDPELERRLEALAGAIVSKILHAPSARLRRAVRDGGSEALVEAAVEIFELESRAPPRDQAIG
jgi:glutamyl-tRNA reductase